MSKRLQKGTKVEAITNYVRSNINASKEQVEKGIGFKFSSSQLAVARKRVRAESDNIEARLENGIMSETDQRRRLALDMITQHLSTINRLLMELR